MSQTIEVDEELCSWWMDPDAQICLALPNDKLGHFLQMFDGSKILPNAYPPHVWERLGWEKLGPIVPDVVAEALAKIE